MLIPDKIPESFHIFGQKITVRRVESLTGTQGALGHAYIDQNRIDIQTSLEGNQIPEENLMRVFWHETLHQVLAALSYKEQCDDEHFVDTLAHALHQVTMSADYKRAASSGRIKAVATAEDQVNQK